jgi:spore coat polysaccharide biosynthesis protein SpsF (cytidylyltransferase family)
MIRRERGLFRPLVIPAPRNVRRPEVRLTVDTDLDLSFMRQIAARLDDWTGEPELREILVAADQVPVEEKCA